VIAKPPGAIVLLVAFGSACKKEKASSSTSGSATAAGSGSLIATASGSGSEIAVADAAVPDAPVATGPQITRAGVGALRKFEWWKQDETATAALVDRALAGVADAKACFEVMDVPGAVEREAGYFASRRGEREPVPVQRASSENGEAPAVVIVWTPEIPTDDGIRVGSKVSEVAAKHADLACTYERDGLIADTVAASLLCTSKAAPEIRYVISVEKTKLKDGPVTLDKIANQPVVAIAHEPS